MSWQDDLRQLDQALAMGQIAADDYRKRRDQLLAAAAGSATSPAAPEQPSAPQQPAPPQPVAPPPPPVQQQPSPSQGPDSGPFAPPFRWEPSSDSTQVVAGDNPDRTQVVPPVHGGGQDADRTQVFQPLGGQQPPRSAAQPPWGQQQPGRPDGAPPPWGDDQYGAPVSGLNPTWLTQGPEVFESGGEKKSGTFLKIAIALVVVIGIGVGAFFIFRGQGEEQPQGGGTTSQQQPPTSTKRPKDDLEIATLPGQAAEKAEIKEFSDVEATDVLKDEEKAAYKNAGAGKARLVTSNLPRSIGALVMTVEVSSAETAKSGATQLAQLQKSFTMKDYTGTVPAGVTAQQFAKSESLPAVIRGHYRHKNTIVRVQVAGDDMAQIAKVFDEILAAQLAELPADA